MEECFKEMLKRVYENLKPLGYKKDGSNFRVIQEDGLAKIINFQKSKWNSKESISFTINVGIYFEKEAKISNTKFKEYNCQIRQRPSCITEKYRKDTWWVITPGVDLEELYSEICNFVCEEVLRFLAIFEDKSKTFDIILSGKAQEYTAMPVMCYDTARMMVELGHGSKVLPFIKDKESDCFKELVERIERENNGNI